MTKETMTVREAISLFPELLDELVTWGSKHCNLGDTVLANNVDTVPMREVDTITLQFCGDGNYRTQSLKAIFRQGGDAVRRAWFEYKASLGDAEGGDAEGSVSSFVAGYMLFATCSVKTSGLWLHYYKSIHQMPESWHSNFLTFLAGYKAAKYGGKKDYYKSQGDSNGPSKEESVGQASADTEG